MKTQQPPPKTHPQPTTNNNQAQTFKDKESTILSCFFIILIDFARKYKGKTIQIEIGIWFYELHGNYTTRYDILVGAGDFDPNSCSGPSFKFEDVNYYNLGLDTLFVEDEIWVGRNVIITAKV
ncbi:MAG: DUF4839 domain-containing protein, partial [Clostridia bacterium]|nr:DUF4839 domain-containing protein [Clostridia bacterium]